MGLKPTSDNDESQNTVSNVEPQEFVELLNPHASAFKP